VTLEIHAPLQPTHAIVAELRSVLEGTVDDSSLARAQYATDASNYRVVPEMVVLPRTRRDVEEAVAIARNHRMPVTVRGGGTSCAGNAIGPGMVLDFSRFMNRILSIDPESVTAVVEPGVVLSDLQNAAARTLRQRRAALSEA
jgi:FAD/FMN-containing dehydrogenase